MRYSGIILTLLSIVSGGLCLWAMRKNLKKHGLFITSLITFVMAVVVYHNYLVGNASYLYSVSDGYIQFLPIYNDFKNMLLDGEFSAWNFSIGFGAAQSYVKLF